MTDDLAYALAMIPLMILTFAFCDVILRKKGPRR